MTGSPVRWRTVCDVTRNMERRAIVSNITIRLITSADDAAISKIIRENLKKYHLDIPGTAYYDTELDCLSGYYNTQSDMRRYFVAESDDGTVIGGVGIAAFSGFEYCAEIQKLYLADGAKGKGFGKQLMQTAEDYAKSAGYRFLYLETHTNLEAAIGLYEKLGFRQIEKPADILHSTMNRFYLKKI